MEEIKTLNSILKSFKINAECVRYQKIRNIALYDMLLMPLTRVQHIEKYIEEIALQLKLKSIPLVKIIPQEGIIRLEAVMEAPHKVSYFDNLYNIGMSKALDIPMYLGSSLDDKPIIIDIAQNPHMLIAGTTGSGKSVLLHNLMAGALRLMDTEIFAIDTKRIEFKPYKIFGNVKIANDYVEALCMLKHLHKIMEYRYKLIDSGVDTKLNNIILIIDELADIMTADEDKRFSQLLCALAQKCRSSKIFLVVATQRPSVDVLPGIIRANLPARISLKVASHIDSKIILNETGSERLIGYGDAIINNYNYSYERFQVAYTTPDEICNKYSNFAFNLIPKNL